MSDLIRASGIWMKPKEQVSKFTGTNTVTSSRTLVKSHKVFQNDSPEAVLEKSWFENNSQRIYPEETIMNSFLQLPHNLQLHWKRTPSQLLSDEFWKGFSECSFMSEHWQSNRRELNYSSAYVLVKSWSEEFHKIHPKETMMEFFFS